VVELLASYWRLGRVELNSDNFEKVIEFTPGKSRVQIFTSFHKARVKKIRGPTSAIFK
jgi:hypothetical protein